MADRLKVFTFRTREEIAELERLTREEPYRREAQRVLAEDVNTLVHGAEATRQAIEASAAVFGKGAFEELDESTLAAVADALPGTTVTGRQEQPVVDLLVGTGLSESKSACLLYTSRCV